MAMLLTTSLVFKVRRCQLELIAPAKPTPHEFKQLSDVDDQEGLKFPLRVIQFYRHNPSMEGRDPVMVIKKAISETLVFYYPLAGRLREGPGKKLFVECTGEGMLFIEADADVTLEQFGDTPRPPFPCLEELLYDDLDTGFLDCPLLLIQVTRLKCGGFILGLSVNHTISDAYGLIHFMTALAEIARRAPAPAVLPVWQRTLLNARDPPTPTFPHLEYDQLAATATLDGNPHRSFFFGPAQISALRKTLPTHLRHCSSFELLTACLWRLRTAALQPDPQQEVRILCLVNARSKFKNPPLPSGYYGNVIAFAAACTTAGELCQNPLGHALELIRRAKAEVTEEYMRSAADFLVMKGRPPFNVGGSYVVTDVTKAGFEKLDFGWGEAAYGGPAAAGEGRTVGMTSFYAAFKNKNGEEGILVPLYLPAPAMERFVVELDALLKAEEQIEVGNQKPKSILSAL